MVAGFHLAGRQGLLLGFFLSFLLAAFIYYYADVRLIAWMKGKRLEGHDPWGILEISLDLAKKAKMPVPKIYVCRFSCPTAISIGRSWKNSKIFISESLLEKLDEKELKAVLAHEFAKIHRLDTLNFGISSIIAAAVLSASHFLDNLLPRKDKDKIGPISRGLAPIISIMAFVSISQKNYYQADKLASSWLEKPEDLAMVLWKLQSYAYSQPLEIPVDMAHLFIVNPLPRNTWTRYFHPQPSFESRIENLVGYFPL